MNALPKEPRKFLYDLKDQYQRELNLARVILPILLRYDGKKVSRAIETAIRKELPSDYLVSLRRTLPANSANLVVQKNSGSPKIALLLVKSGDEPLDYPAVYALASSLYLAHEDRIEDIDALLPRLDGLVVAYNLASIAMEKAQTAFGPVGPTLFKVEAPAPTQKAEGA